MEMAPAVTMAIDTYRSGVMRSFKTKSANTALKTIDVSRVTGGALSAMLWAMFAAKVSEVQAGMGPLVMGPLEVCAEEGR